MIHRDIKPENIMFHEGTELKGSSKAQPVEPMTAPVNKTVKLIDFDTVQEWTPASPKCKRIVGTPGYIAPEAFKGEYTPASDLWSVGVILYILMTGDMPFSEEDIGEDIAGNNVVGGDKAEEVYQRLSKAQIDFDC